MFEPEFPGAVCRTVDPDLFFPETGETDKTRRAKAICSTCYHIDDCAAFAITNRIPVGIFGGLTAIERRTAA